MKVVKTVRLIGYRVDDEKNPMQLFVHRGEHYLRYKGEDIALDIQYRMVKKGTYLDDVKDIPYFVLNNRVYPIKSFESLYQNNKRRWVSL